MSAHACREEGCNFAVILTPGGWAHVDTHGVEPDHKAWPDDVEPDEEFVPVVVKAAPSQRIDPDILMTLPAGETAALEEPEAIPFLYTRTIPDPALASEDYWQGWADAENHIATLMGWAITDA